MRATDKRKGARRHNSLIETAKNAGVAAKKKTQDIHSGTSFMEADKFTLYLSFRCMAMEIYSSITQPKGTYRLDQRG